MNKTMNKFLLTTAAVLGLGVGVFAQQAKQTKKPKTGSDCDNLLLAVPPTKNKFAVISPCEKGKIVGTFESKPKCDLSETPARVFLATHVNQYGDEAKDPKGKTKRSFNITTTNGMPITNGRGFPEPLMAVFQSNVSGVFDEQSKNYKLNAAPIWVCFKFDKVEQPKMK